MPGNIWHRESVRCLSSLDETACILSRNGDPQTLQQLSALGLTYGTYCAEGIIGTCALSLAAISGQAVKTMADQHFKQALWNGFVQRRCLTARAH